MENVYQGLLEKRDAAELMRKSLGLSDEILRQQAEWVRGPDIARLGELICNGYRESGIVDALTKGWLVLMYRPVAEEQNDPDLLANFYKAIGTSETQATREVNCFQRLGEPLLTEPKLRNGFVCVEAMKLVASPSFEEQLLQQVFERIRQGEQFRIKDVQELIKSHSSKDTHHGKATRAKKKRKQLYKSSKRLWTFEGLVIDCQFMAKSPKSLPELNAILCDLEAAMAFFLNKYSSDDAA